jgi:cytochrome P450
MALAKYKDLKHLPGSRGNFMTGNFIEFISNASGLWARLKKQYGDVFYLRVLHRNQVMLGGIDTNKRILVDESKRTESKEAWETALGDLFPNSLMLMDGADHKYHRSIMQDAFKKTAMQGYLIEMPAIITENIAKLKETDQQLMFPYFKMLTLRLATRVFFGLDDRQDLKKINKAITEIVLASTALPLKIPFTTYYRGISGRKYLKNLFLDLVEERRQRPGNDLFSMLCLAKNEEGEMFTDEEIADHLNFILMASHDTTAITLTWMSYFLAKYPEWQNIVREEVKDVKMDQLELSHFRDFTQLSLVLKEALRIHPPLTMVVRKLTESMEIGQYLLPQDTLVACSFQLTHQDVRVWTDPDRFDPLRFSDERREHMKCPFAYAPFGAGQHHCIGYSFAEMQIKLVMIELLQKFELSVPEGYEAQVQDVPLKQPKDDMPLILKKL